jgi:hypothetical protein
MQNVKIYIINTLLFIILFFLYYFTGFLLGYASNAKYVTASWILFAAFLTAHLIINILFITRPKYHDKKAVILSSIYITILYGIITVFFW